MNHQFHEEVEALVEATNRFRVEKTTVSTRHTSREMRTDGTPSSGKGSKTVWIIVGPWDPKDPVHRAKRSVKYGTRKGAQKDVDRLNR